MCNTSNIINVIKMFLINCCLLSFSPCTVHFCQLQISLIAGTSADSLCKQFGPRSGPTKSLSWSGSRLFDTDSVPQRIFWKSEFWKKISRWQQKHANGLKWAIVIIGCLWSVIFCQQLLQRTSPPKLLRVKLYFNTKREHWGLSCISTTIKDINFTLACLFLTHILQIYSALKYKMYENTGKGEISFPWTQQTTWFWPKDKIHRGYFVFLKWKIYILWSWNTFF